MMTSGVYFWWFALCGVATLNLVAWALSVRGLQRRQPRLAAETFVARRQQLMLSGVYVFGCAYRSFFPVFDVPRLCLVDSWLSSVMVGRSVATLAEVCFVAQWALMLREVSSVSGCRVGRRISSVIVPMIVLAEICSWYSVLTTANIGHVMEETLWGLSAGLMIVSLVIILPRCLAEKRPLILAWCAASTAYVAYMFLVDVPRYWSRWLADEAQHRPYMSVLQGMFDTSHRWMTSYLWTDWRGEMVWMSLYFSVAVWLSISLIHAPTPHEFLAKSVRPAGRARVRLKGSYQAQS